MKRATHLFIHYLPILCILAVGAYLRLYKISQYLTFLGDEGRDVLIVKHMIVDGKWTLLGPTASVGGFYMGPIYYYFMLPFLWLWKLDPVGPAIMVALVGIATIYLIYKTASEMFGKHEAYIAAALYALSPIIIAYSRASWNPNIVPFFSTLLIYLCFRIAVHSEWKYVFWVGIILGIGIQLHYTFLFLFPAVGLWLIWHSKTKEYISRFLTGLLGFIIGFSPFLAFEVRHGFTNTRGILSFIFTSKDTGFSFMHFFVNVSDVLFRLFGRLLLRFPDGLMLATLPAWLKNVWTIGVWSFVLLVLGFCFKELRKKTSGKERVFALQLLFLLLLSVLIFFGIYKKPIYDYYFVILFAVPFIMMAVAITRIRKLGVVGKGIAICVVLFLVAFNWQGRPFKYAPNNQLGQTKTIAQAVLDKTDGKPFNFALITGGNSDQAYRYFFEIWGRPPVTIENPAADPARHTVTDQLLIVCEYPSCEPLGNSLWEVAGFGRAEIAGKWDVSVVKVYKLIHYQGK
jgi:4-amino-4-deoxy-L-arabinose transferase-like glycosyltransferase